MLLTRFLSTVCIGLALPAAGQSQSVIVDNSDPGFSVLSQAWFTASAGGHYGADYRYRSTTSTPGSVEWRPNLPASGIYQVDVWYRAANDRPDDAAYTIAHANGFSQVLVDQRLNGNKWFTLGEFEFDAGTSGSIRLSSDAEPGNTIVADAVRFTRTIGLDIVPEMRACWLTQYKFLGLSDDALRQIARNIKSGNMNTVYISVYSGATVWWPSKAYREAGGNWGSSTIDWADRLIDIFQEEGLKVGAWFEYGLAVGFASHPIAVANPDWLARDENGDAVTGENGGFVFLSPTHPEVQQLMVDMVTELAVNYSFDDIQIDRFRWGRKVTGREYGYEDVTKDLYFQINGSNPPSNVNNSQWVNFREGLVNNVVEQCYGAIKTANPYIVVSSAPTGAYGITQHMQRWSDWVNGGYMDLIMPQMYRTSLSSFITEFNIQYDQAPAHNDKLAVGYRASDDTDWSLVADQLDYARANGVAHGTLWVYHQYTSQIAIQDEIDNLPGVGQPWELPAYNPFTSDRMVQLVVDNRDSAVGQYSETGSWFFAGGNDFFRFDTRVATGGANRTATFSAAVPKSGRYETYAWYSSAANRNPAAAHTVQHYNGSSTVSLDQRSSGGQWVLLGEYIFEEGGTLPRMTVSTAGSSASQYTSADALKLKLVGYALGDVNGDGVIDDQDHISFEGCYTGPVAVGTVPCEAFDFDNDADFDLADLADYQKRFGD